MSVTPKYVLTSLLVALSTSLTGAYAEADLAQASSVAPGECQPVGFDGGSYTVCTIQMGAHDLRLFRENGEQYFWSDNVHGSFDALNEDLAQDGLQLSFAVNGGMYHNDRTAVGLYVAAGKESQALNGNSGPGNFHLLPNGVFYWDEARAGVLETSAYAKAALKPLYATQSGPMLVIDGELHPRFIIDGTSLKIRNGVGVSADGRQIHFALSEQPVNFETFGRLFRDHLKVPNALFLDGGSASQIFAPNLGRNDNAERMGPIIAVVKAVEPSALDEKPVDAVVKTTSQPDD